MITWFVEEFPKNVMGLAGRIGQLCAVTYDKADHDQLLDFNTRILDLQSDIDQFLEGADRKFEARLEKKHK